MVVGCSNLSFSVTLTFDKQLTVDASNFRHRLIGMIELVIFFASLFSRYDGDPSSIFNPNLIWDYPVLGFIFLVENVLKHLLKPYWGKFTVYFKNSVSFVLREKSTLFLVFENVICHGRFGFFSDTQRCLGVGLQRALQFNWIYFGKKR